MAEKTEQYWNPNTNRWETRTVGTAGKTDEAKYNPALQSTPTASSTNPPKGGLGAIAAANAAKKKKPTQGDQAAAVEKQ